MNRRQRLHLPREWHPLIDAAEAAGWVLMKTAGSHVKWQAPNGAVVFSSSTPSDRRAMLNTRSELRRKGLTI